MSSGEGWVVIGVSCVEDCGGGMMVGFDLNDTEWECRFDLGSGTKFGM